MPDNALDFHERRQLVTVEVEKAGVALAVEDQNIKTLRNVLLVHLQQVLGSEEMRLLDISSVQVYNDSMKRWYMLRISATEAEKLRDAYDMVFNDFSGEQLAVPPIVGDKPIPSPDGGEKGDVPPPSAGKKDDVPPPEEKNDSSGDTAGLSAGAKRVLEEIVASKQYKKLGGPVRLLALITSTSLASRWFTSVELCRHVRTLDPQFFMKNNDIFFALNGATSSQTKFFDKKPATKEDIKELKSPRAQFLYRMNDAGKLQVKKLWAAHTRKLQKKKD
ncbi:MAG: hypothetical protein AAB575_01020 [Patescibacteria group bacterium]